MKKGRSLLVIGNTGLWQRRCGWWKGDLIAVRIACYFLANLMSEKWHRPFLPHAHEFTKLMLWMQ
jgi:hypothetical protein